MKQRLLLNSGLIIQVSDEDYDLLWKYDWRSLKGYAYANKNSVFLHRLIAERMSLKGEVDHEDQNKGNNQRYNLRKCTRSQNKANVVLQRNNTTSYKGVSFHKAQNQYCAYIKVNQRLIHLGYFDDPYEASQAYDEAALRYFGSFAHTNGV